MCCWSPTEKGVVKVDPRKAGRGHGSYRAHMKLGSMKLGSISDRAVR